jgi:phospholipid/cholesterol/gamma-HCH transport system ATP-binding protein
MSVPVIQMKGVRKAFAEQDVLRGIDLEIGAGEAVVVIGRSGSGKSVMLKQMCGLIRPDSGEVWVDGLRIDRLGERALVPTRRRLGYVFQGSALFDSMTVSENVRLPLVEQRTSVDEAAERVQRALERVGLGDSGDKMPSELSGGMKKRVGLARAIVGDVVSILYDEPTTGLDPVTAASINDLILQLNCDLKITSIAVTHDMASAFRIADRIAMLHEGVIHFTGTPEEVRDVADPIVRQFVEGRSSPVAGDV